MVVIATCVLASSNEISDNSFSVKIVNIDNTVNTVNTVNTSEPSASSDQLSSIFFKDQCFALFKFGNILSNSPSCVKYFFSEWVLCTYFAPERTM